MEIKCFFNFSRDLKMFLSSTHSTWAKWRLPRIVDVPFIQTSLTSSIAIPTGKYSKIVVLLFIFMGLILVGFAKSKPQLYFVFLVLDNRTLVTNGPIIRILFMTDERWNREIFIKFKKILSLFSESRYCHFVTFGTKTSPLQLLVLWQIIRWWVAQTGVWARITSCILTFWAVTPPTQWSIWCPSQCPWWRLSVPGANHQIISEYSMTSLKAETSKALQSAQRVWVILEMWAWDSSSGSSSSELWGWIKYSSKF